MKGVMSDLGDLEERLQSTAEMLAEVVGRLQSAEFMINVLCKALDEAGMELPDIKIHAVDAIQFHQMPGGMQ